MKAHKWLICMAVAAALTLLTACGDVSTEVASTQEPTTIVPTSTATSTPTNTPTATNTPSPTRTPTPTTRSLITPTSQPPLATPTIQQILDPDWAVDYSFKWLFGDVSWNYSSSNFAQVRFPNGDRGVFVALGFGPNAGARLLYRIDDDRVTLVHSPMPDSYVWGLRNLASGEKVEVEFLDILGDDHVNQVIKVTGAGHSGTGLWSEGNFLVIEITDDGMKTVFSGVDIEGMGDLPVRSYEYEYVDLDGDGVKEIVKEGQECDVRLVDGEWKQEECEAVREVYRYDGVSYVLDK